MIVDYFCKKTGIRKEDIEDIKDVQKYNGSAYHNPAVTPSAYTCSVHVSFRDGNSHVYREYDEVIGPTGTEYALKEERVQPNQYVMEKGHEWAEDANGIIRCIYCKEIRGFANRDLLCVERPKAEAAHLVNSIAQSGMTTYSNLPSTYPLTVDSLVRVAAELRAQAGAPLYPDKTPEEQIPTKNTGTLGKFLDHKKK